MNSIGLKSFYVNHLQQVLICRKNRCSSCGGGGEKLTSLTDPVGSTTSFSYDLRGLMASRTDPLGKVASFTHDANGRLTGRVDRNEHAVAYTRDAAGRVTRIDYPDGSSVAYEYDELGRITGMRDAVTTTTCSYDGAGRVTGVGDADGFTIGYVYDDAGNVTQITYPDGSAATYAYDALNRLTSVTTSEGETASYSYDAAGRLASSTGFDEIATTHTHDAAGRLTGMSSVVASYFFTRDGNGRIVHSIETEPLAPSPVASSTAYGYNDQKNRLLSAGAVAYGYDDEGQLTSAGPASYSYDYEHRLAAIGSDARFAYDGRGNRLRATRGGVVKRYIYDPWGNLLAEADGNGNITRTYIYGHGLLAMRTAGGDLYCYHFNTTGSTIALTDATGGIVNSYAYDPFGNVLGQQESVSQPFKFVGQYGVMTEANDSLYYMRARYYDPRVGRFISEDPIGFAGGDVNLYGYVQNDPVNGIDPGGLMKLPADPGQLPPDWIPDSSHRDPNGLRFRDSNGRILDWHKGRPGLPGWRGKDHYHDPCNFDDEHLPPGTDIPDPAPRPPLAAPPTSFTGPLLIIIVPPGAECIFNPAGCRDPS